MHYLSKSKLISGRQCSKRLWLEKYRPDEKEFSASTEAAFAVGHRVGEAAQQAFPGGILIEHDQELSQALRETKDLLAKPGPITLFEATFQSDGVLIRADILIRDAADKVRLIEVKASTSVKDYHLNDCAIQLWVLEQQGIDVARIELAHINNQFVYAGDGNYQGLFTYADVTEEARKLQPSVPRLVAEMRELLDGPEPDIAMGAQCTKPFECPFIDYCKGPQAEKPVSWLPGGASLHAKLEAEGYRDIRDIPAGYLTNEMAEWCRRVTVTGEPDLNPAAAAELGELGWPRYYFDFETLGPAVPIFAGTRPYNAQAFQWSCHIEYGDGSIEHKEFLADGSQPPMRACAEALIEALGDTGPVLMYTSYEDGVLKNLIGLFPDLEAPLQAIRDRLVDLHPVTKRNYCHPDMHGSWSIKSVIPTVAPELSYEDLGEVKVGTDAEFKFLEMISAETRPNAVLNCVKRCLNIASWIPGPWSAWLTTWKGGLADGC
jgi:hypothetical protein